MWRLASRHFRHADFTPPQLIVNYKYNIQIFPNPTVILSATTFPYPFGIMAYFWVWLGSICNLMAWLPRSGDWIGIRCRRLLPSGSLDPIAIGIEGMATLGRELKPHFIAVMQGDFARGSDRKRFGQIGAVDVQERVRAQML